MAARLLAFVGATFLAAQLFSGTAVAAADPNAPPGLPDAAAQALGVMATSPATVAGIKSYKVRLWNGGTIYAIPGGDQAVVAVLKDGMYHWSQSVLFRSGPYILLAPSFLDVPNAVLVPGKQYGMEAIDTDPYLCRDSTIPGPRLC